MNNPTDTDLFPDVNYHGIDNWTPLHFAAYGGHANIVEFLIEQEDIDINPVSSINRTPVHMAAAEGQLAILKILKDGGAEFILKDFDENTALHLASEQGKLEVVDYLLSLKIELLSAKNKFGYNPVDIAANYEIRKLFTAEDPNVDASIKDMNYGRTAVDEVLLHNDRVTSVKKLMHKFN